jgi:hypothetical protein
MVGRFASRLASRLAVGLALAVLLGTSLVLAGLSPAQAACTCQDKTLGDHATAADAVFSGTVRESRNAEPEGGGGAGGGGRAQRQVVHVVDVETVWQEDGTVVTDTVRVSSPRAESACGLGDIEPGTEFVFFAKARENGFQAAKCGGSRPLTTSFESEVVAELGDGRAVVPDDERPPVELTPLDTSAPGSVTRAAAPGAALVIVGLLGLVLVRFARSRRA